MLCISKLSVLQSVLSSLENLRRIGPSCSSGLRISGAQCMGRLRRENSGRDRQQKQKESFGCDGCA